MQNIDKWELREYVKEGMTFRQIRGLVDCADSTIRRYIEVFRPKEDDEKKEEINQGKELNYGG